MKKGFYKFNNNKLLYAQNYVLNKDYQLYASCCKRRFENGQWVECNEEHTEYTEDKKEIVDGWFWFDSEESAKTHFGVVDEEPQEEPKLPQYPRLNRPTR